MQQKGLLLLWDIDVFTKYAWIIPFKETINETFNEMIAKKS